MVPRSLIISALMVVTAASGRADLQFTPRESYFELEGMKLKQLAFSDGGAKEVTYQQPPGWSYSGDAGKLTLHPPNKSQAEATVSKVTLPKPGVFDDASMKQMVEEALASAPKGSTSISLVSQQRNPVLIAGKETFLVVVSYSFYGGNYQRSLMFMNRGNEQVRFQFVSRAADFEELQRAFLGSHCTWENL